MFKSILIRYVFSLAPSGTKAVCERMGHSCGEAGSIRCHVLHYLSKINKTDPTSDLINAMNRVLALVCLSNVRSPTCHQQNQNKSITDRVKHA